MRGFLAAFRGVASTGVWAAGLGVVSVGIPVLLGIQNLLGPKIAHAYAARGPRGFRRSVLKITTVISLPMLLLCLLMFIWGGRLLILLYGQQYVGNSQTVAILALNLPVTAVTFSFSRALFAINRADVDFLVNFTALCIMVTVGFWMVRSFGPPGAAIGALGANFVTSAVRAAVFLMLPCHTHGVRTAD